MSKENYNSVPAGFRGLRVLLVDRDTSSLLNVAKEMELFSYRVTTTELASVALSILKERKHSFDLIMADVDIHERGCFEFIESVQFIKDLPVILMSTDVDKDMIKEAVIRGGACFFMKKPVSSKNLKNVWQHVFRHKRYRNVDSDSEGAKTEERNEEIEKGPRESESVSDRFPVEEMRGSRAKRSRTDNDERGDFKRRKTENECSDKSEESLTENEGGMEVGEDRVLENELHEEDVRLKLKGVIEGEGEPESVSNMTNELSLTQPQFLSQKYGVGTMETRFNTHGLSADGRFL